MGRRGRAAGGVEGGGSAGGLEELPDILYVPDLAGLLRVSAKAVRHRAARGQVPEPMRLGKELAWTRDAVLGWLRDNGRSARSVDMKITLRPYAKDTSRWQLDIAADGGALGRGHRTPRRGGALARAKKIADRHRRHAAYLKPRRGRTRTFARHSGDGGADAQSWIWNAMDDLVPARAWLSPR